MFDSIRTIPVRVRPPYDVRIGSGLLGRCGDYLAALLGQRRIAVLADDTVASLYLDTVTAALEDAGFAVCSHIFPSGEGRKNLSTLTELLEFLASEHLTRTDCVAALGGGVTGDMAGFAAAVYLRGIRYVQLPTTLLAAVDASVGGKTAIDLRGGKNLAGAFYQPQAVLCDLDTLDTLPAETFADGCAEVIKYGMIGDPALLDKLERLDFRGDPEEVAARCIAQKRDLVEQDEFDTGARQLLNLGHTIGHGVEACSGYAISHGKAVAIGMTLVTRAAVSLGLCPAPVLPRLEALLHRYGLPTTTEYPARALYEKTLSDKKRAGDTITLVVPTGWGKSRLRQIPVGELLTWIERGLGQ